MTQLLEQNGIDLLHFRRLKHAIDSNPDSITELKASAMGQARTRHRAHADHKRQAA
jgi:hypothetical protein